MNKIDIIIPVYNEGENISDALTALQRWVTTPFRVLICYDRDDDNTLPVAKKFSSAGLDIAFVKNSGRGVHGAIMAGFDASTAEAVMVFGADEPSTAEIIDRMYVKIREGNDVVVGSRLMKGGSMVDRSFKAFLVRSASFVLHRLVFLPATDATYAWRMFSKRMIDTIEVESTEGFTYSIEFLVKCHRLGWGIAEVPAQWMRRTRGKSRFNFRRWLPLYARWFFYALETTYLRKGPETVALKSAGPWKQQ